MFVNTKDLEAKNKLSIPKNLKQKIKIHQNLNKEIIIKKILNYTLKNSNENTQAETLQVENKTLHDHENKQFNLVKANKTKCNLFPKVHKINNSILITLRMQTKNKNKTIKWRLFAINKKLLIK